MFKYSAKPMVIKKLMSFIISFFSFRGRRRIKDSSCFEGIASNGVDKVKEGPNESLGGLARSEVVEVDQVLCCVCLSRLKEGEERRVLPCLHEFHRVCVDGWFNVCRKTCPVCRFSMEDEDKIQKREELTEEMVIWFSSFHAAGF